MRGGRESAQRRRESLGTRNGRGPPLVRRGEGEGSGEGAAGSRKRPPLIRRPGRSVRVGGPLMDRQERSRNRACPGTCASGVARGARPGILPPLGGERGR